MFCRKCHCMHDTRRCPIDSDSDSDNDVSGEKTSKILSKNRICDEDSESESNEETNNDSSKYICCKESDEDDHLPNKKCKKNNDCPGYFSTEHHAIFCSKRLEGFNFFFPRIDYDLIPRFLEIVSIEEKFIMMVSSAIAERFIKLNPIKIEPEFLNIDENDIPESDDIVIFNDEMTLQKSNLTKDKAFFDSLNAKIFLCFARRIEITESQLSAQAVLLLLSTYTRHFNFYETTCEPNLSFSDIIKTAPNLETIEIDGSPTNIIFEKTWIEDFLKYKIGKNFYFLNIKLDILELNVINLVEFVKKKCKKEVSMEIKFNEVFVHSNVKENIKIFNSIITDLSEYLDSEDEGGALTIGFDGCDTQSFSFERIKKPKRSQRSQRRAKKRKYY